MALHLLIMPVTGAGTFADQRRPKYVSSFDGVGWAACDGGSYWTVLCDLSATALAAIVANADCVEIPMTNLGAASNAVIATKMASIVNGTTVPGAPVLTVPGGATFGQMARLALEHNQPALVGRTILLSVLPLGSVTL